MKRQASVLIASALLLSAPAFAQTTETLPTTPPAVDAPATPTPVVPDATLGAGTVIAPEGYTAVPDFSTVTAEQVQGIALNGPAGESIGQVADVELGADGAASGLIADVGGFLGFGEHRVKLGFDQVRVFSNADGDMVAVSDLTKDQLKAMPEYVSPET
ncbi:PRC-barrel domain-containing protein [Gemmobacter megaterium]|uniref:PRC-barrel domain-containing protein n=1 Tax=Gemmobacter megaterium TaxID=1086013 RepID=A0A1N7KHX6_9RHOB|nr:PRC-barrel domain-containing protein [Gemmobacter megaterium]GGE02251.1 hypothetical protein GCM10011345_04410 [Gemmobacter megaterium]SIS61185.1 PRC-barrel domain-containing protein [Gemmobacter megaterium]